MASLLAQIKAFSESNGATQLEFPATLSSEERRKVHQYAGVFGLEHASVGKGDQRRIIISKMGPKKEKGRQEIALDSSGEEDQEERLMVVNTERVRKALKKRNFVDEMSNFMMQDAEVDQVR